MARKIFSTMLTAALLYSFLGNVLMTQVILELSDHSHHTESSFEPEGIQIRLVHDHEESQGESERHHASEIHETEIASFPIENHFEGTMHPDHEIRVPSLDIPFFLVNGASAIPDLSLLQFAMARCPLDLRLSIAFSRLPEKRYAPLPTRLRSVVILV
ncbi:MAG: hypothetical protein M3Y08_18835 [Fibrobacterota bacterium]|nr:hypothetical protein [Fibrobacterota bacterium]